MKVYAKQIDPEQQESPLMLFYEWDNISVFGNWHYIEHLTGVLERIKEVIDNCALSDVLYDIKTGGYYSDFYKDNVEAIIELLPPEKECYSEKDIKDLSKLFLEYTYTNMDNEYDFICKVASVVTGHKYMWHCIRGWCKSDWQYVFYDTTLWDEKSLERFKVEYFNTGDEWIINDDYSIYTISWNDNDIKKEIAANCGYNVEDIILLKFDGYTKTPKYIEV